jgi:hypothetical protein
MERKVTNSFINHPNQKPRSGAHDHAPTAAEIQRWEDDGGAILPDQPQRIRGDCSCEAGDWRRAAA